MKIETQRFNKRIGSPAQAKSEESSYSTFVPRASEFYCKLAFKNYIYIGVCVCVCVCCERLPIWRVAENTLNKQSQTADKG